MIFKSGPLTLFGWENLAEAIYCSKKEEFSTLSGNFEGSLVAMELESSLKETLAHLT